MKFTSIIRCASSLPARLRGRAWLWKQCICPVCVLALAAVLSWCLIEWEDAEADHFPGGIVLRDQSGEVCRVTLGADDSDCRPSYVAHMNDWIVKAVVASEDRTFFSHHGVRPLSIVRAFLQNIFYRRRISGASTLTMQTVRLMKPHRKGYLQKYAEAIRALKMERRRDKIWILSQYLNRAPFGANLIGIEAAAHGWFGKSAVQLGLGEAALLAGMVQAPSRFRPDRHLAQAIIRRDYVLKRMFECGLIDAAQREAAAGVVPVVRPEKRPFRFPHYCDYYQREIAQNKNGDFTMPLNADIQRLCESVVCECAAQSKCACAAIVRDVETDDVSALAVSADYFSSQDGQFNTALAPRPAGSTLKPFLAARAMDDGFVTPEQRLADVPRVYQGYRPVNFDGKYRGVVTLREALILSLNLPFVELLSRLGIDAFADTLRSLGLKHMNHPNETYGLGMAIGNVEVSLEELTKAYCILARAADGKETSLFSSPSAYLISDILSGTQRSAAALGHIADVKTPRFAWKTGTSAGHRDAWTIAWNPRYVIGVWCGHLNSFGDTSIVGAQVAAPRAWQIARGLYPRQNGPWFTCPTGIVQRCTCLQTGLPASPECPKTEYTPAIEGRSSPRLCEKHRRDSFGQTNRLSFLKPQDGDVFRLVPDLAQQRIACVVQGVSSQTHLWWFLDGLPAGETSGTSQKAIPMTPGKHALSCLTDDGREAFVQFEIAE